MVSPPCIIRVRVWIVFKRIVILAHIVCLLLICK
jgi:hypothetical protein